MPPYESGNVTQCNTESCKRCRNKYNCSRYVNYLEDIVNSPVSQVVSTPVVAGPVSSPIEFGPILKTLADVVAKVSILDGNIKELSAGLNNNQTRIADKFTEMTGSSPKTETYPTPDIPVGETDDINDMPSEGGIVVYNADVSPLQKGDTYYEEKKTIFGGTKMVERTVK